VYSYCKVLEVLITFKDLISRHVMWIVSSS